MFEKLDRKIIDELLDIHNDLCSYKTYFPKIIAEKSMHLNDKIELIKSFINNYAALYYEGLTDASIMTAAEINAFVNGVIEETDELDNKCSKKDILTRLIKIYYEVDTEIQEFGEDICAKHLQGLIQRRYSLRLYIDIFARNNFHKFAKITNIPVEEMFKCLHGVYPVPYQKQRRKKTN